VPLPACLLLARALCLRALYLNTLQFTRTRIIAQHPSHTLAQKTH
jgi:uncharacterized membrane protein